MAWPGFSEQASTKALQKHFQIKEVKITIFMMASVNTIPKSKDS